jgi:predicted dehydrogenase
MKAGKDVYCEKPLSHTITEGIEMVKTAKAGERILQTGSMQRSWDNFRQACSLVRNGYIGEIKKVLVNVGDPAVSYNLPEESTPAEINWSGWCGPAPLLDYNHRLAPSRNDVKFWPDWRLFREVGGGILADWGAHMFDIAQWALGTDDTGPIEYIPPKDPNAKRGMKMIYENGVEMYHEDFGRGWGVRFIGSEGTIDISRDYFEADPKKIIKVKEIEFETNLYRVRENHYQDWLEAITNRTQPICNPEVGHRSASICNIANIAYQLNRPLKWDPVKEDFINDAEATALKTRKNRAY